MAAQVSEKVRYSYAEAGRLLRVELHSPKGNVIDLEVIQALSAIWEAAQQQPQLKALMLCGTGDHFSFGASVPEHRAEQVGQLLPLFHECVRSLCELGIPSFAVLRGSCLGGGLELAAGCTYLFAAPDAKLAQPEIKLGVFAPLGSILLPWRIGGRALDLLVSGRTLSALEAKELGLLFSIEPDPEAACLAFIRKHILPLSASSLRFAERAARRSLTRALHEDLPAIEKLYLHELMATPDAREGIEAFLAKRPPRYQGEGG